VASNTVVIAGCDGQVRTIDLATGRQRAAVSIGPNFAATPAYGSGCVFVGGLGGEYLCVRLSDAKVLWKVIAAANGGAAYASAAVQGTAVIFASRNHTVFRLDRATGRTVWVFKTKDQVESSPVIAGNRVFFGCNDGNLYAVDLASGREVWRFAAGAGISASPAVGQNRLVIGATDGAIYAFGG
jgi:outer membrane protein assembly factor BamB